MHLGKQEQVRVAIFGSGPAGLLAAHAASQWGADYIKVYAEGHRSALHGAQYLHKPITGIPHIPHTRLEHEFRGSLSGYRNKVYGMQWDGEVSPERYSGTTYAWDIRYTYDWLVKEYWDLYVDYIHLSGLQLMGGNGGFNMIHLNNRFDVVFSTIPRRMLCVNPDHEFKAAKIYAMGDAPALGVQVPIRTEADRLVCSGDTQDSWYRTSNVFGHSTVEWPTNKKKPPIEGVVEVQKPLETNCNCWPEIKYVGRYGKWQKGVLVHNAYEDVINTLSRL